MLGRRFTFVRINRAFESWVRFWSKWEFDFVTRARCPRRTTAALLTVLVIGAAVPAAAQELYALAGGQNTVGLGESSYSYSYQYLQNLTEHFTASYTYLNEGHVTNHHR